MKIIRYLALVWAAVCCLHLSYASPVIRYTEQVGDLISVMKDANGNVMRIDISLPVLREQALGSPEEVIASLNAQIESLTSEKKEVKDEAVNTSEDAARQVAIDDNLTSKIYLVILIGDDSVTLGTAFCIDPSGVFVTNDHVVREYKERKKKFCVLASLKGKSYVVEYCPLADPETDLALLCVTAKNLEALPIAVNYEPHSGEIVYSKGFPMAGDINGFNGGELSAKNISEFFAKYPKPFFTKGDITNVGKTNNVADIYHNAPISSGSSGSPLVNSRGEVIGVNKASVDNAQNMNIATSILELKRLIPKIQDIRPKKALQRIFADK